MVDVALSVQSPRQPYRIRLRIVATAWVVLPMIVIVSISLCIKVLPRKPEVVGDALLANTGLAKRRTLLLPDDIALGVNELLRRA